MGKLFENTGVAVRLIGINQSDRINSCQTLFDLAHHVAALVSAGGILTIADENKRFPAGPAEFQLFQPGDHRVVESCSSLRNSAAKGSAKFIDVIRERNGVRQAAPDGMIMFA